jgi:hypothetical protein
MGEARRVKIVLLEFLGVITEQAPLGSGDTIHGGLRGVKLGFWFLIGLIAARP